MTIYKKCMWVVLTIIGFISAKMFVSQCSSTRWQDAKYSIRDENDRTISKLRNFASASSGAFVLDHSNTYKDGHPPLYFLYFIYIGTTAPSPVIALRRSQDPGDCWPMKGHSGYIKVMLATSTYIDGFTLEHINTDLHLTGVLTEAPRNFSVFGVNEETGSKIPLGDFYYDIKGAPEQTFSAKRVKEPFTTVILVINSNYGNVRYTCLYRFKVHGKFDVTSCVNSQYCRSV